MDQHKGKGATPTGAAPFTSNLSSSYGASTTGRAARDLLDSRPIAKIV
jgi:hypothetical protein